jgi:hypothetical protein
MDTRQEVKKDVKSFIKDVVGVNDQDFKDKVWDTVHACQFDGFDVTNEANENIRNLNEDYLKQIMKEDHKDFIPRLKILHPRYYSTMKTFVKRLEAIITNELK